MEELLINSYIHSFLFWKGTCLGVHWLFRKEENVLLYQTSKLYLNSFVDWTCLYAVVQSIFILCVWCLTYL
jgi:hypothetical protein